MFKNFYHFKNATKTMFDESKAQKLNLSQFREYFAIALGFKNISALKSTFDDTANVSLCNVVSVIIFRNDTIQSKKDFVDNQEGNKKAETLFVSEIKNISFVSDEDIESHIEDGYFENSNDGTKLFIVHSC